MDVLGWLSLLVMCLLGMQRAFGKRENQTIYIRNVRNIYHQYHTVPTPPAEPVKKKVVKKKTDYVFEDPSRSISFE